MRSIRLKFELIFLPFIVIAAGFIVAYTLLYYLLREEIARLPIKAHLIDILPFLLSWIPVILWLRPRTRLLKASEHEEKFASFVLIPSLVLAMPAMFVHQYINTSTASLIHIETPEEIGQTPWEKYYTIKNYFIDKHRTGTLYLPEKVGRGRNRKLRMSLYIVSPLLDNINDTSVLYPSVWLGSKYTDEVNPDLSEEGQEKVLRELYRNGIGLRESITAYTYFERIKSSNEYDGYDEAITNVSRGIKDPIILVGRTDPFEERNGDTLNWAFGSLGIGILLFLIMILTTKMNRSALHKWQEQQSKKYGKSS